MGKTILHVDFNGFYAGCEEVYHPQYRNVPLAVGGDAEARLGIILAKNEHAKKFGVQTGQTIREAQTYCPRLVVVKPNFERYLRFCRMSRQLFLDYSPRVEPYGLDEAWIDVSGGDINTDGVHIADDIRRRVWDELGITASVGVANNKAYAKLGSDLRKPNYTNLISPDNYKQVAWPLPAQDLLMVGPSSRSKLLRHGIYTIGDIACTPVEQMIRILNLPGLVVWRNANGIDTSPVRLFSDTDIDPAVSVGHSRTTPHDLCDEHQVLMALTPLAEAVSSRLCKQQCKAWVVSISLRDSSMFWFTRQRKIKRPTQLTGEIVRTAMDLLREHYDFSKMSPVRSLGVRCSSLCSDTAPEQLSMLDDDYPSLQRETAIEASIRGIRAKYGYFSIQKGFAGLDRGLSQVNAEKDHFQIIGTRSGV